KHETYTFVKIRFGVEKALVTVSAVHLVGLASTNQRRVNRFPEWSVESRGIFGRVGQNGDVDVAGVVQRRANNRYLAGHHTRGGHHVRTSFSLGNGKLCIDRVGRIIVDVAGVVKYAT